MKSTTNSIIPPISPPSSSRSFSPLPIDSISIQDQFSKILSNRNYYKLDELSSFNYNPELTSTEESNTAVNLKEKRREEEKMSSCYGFEGGNLNLRRREGRSSSRNSPLVMDSTEEEDEEDTTDSSLLSQLDILILKSSQLLMTSSEILQTTLQTRDSLKRFFDLESDLTLSGMESDLRSSINTIEEFEFEEGRVAESVEQFYASGSSYLDTNWNLRNESLFPGKGKEAVVRADPRSLLRGPRRSRLSLSTISYGPTDLTAPILDSNKKDSGDIDNLATFSFDSLAPVIPPPLPPKPIATASTQLLSSVISKSNHIRTPSFSSKSPLSSPLALASSYVPLPTFLRPSISASSIKMIIEESKPESKPDANFPADTSQISTPPATPKKVAHTRSRTSISPLALLSHAPSRASLTSTPTPTSALSTPVRSLLSSQSTHSSLSPSSPAPSLTLSLTSIESTSLPDSLISPSPSLAHSHSRHTSSIHPIPHSTEILNGKGLGIEEDLRRINVRGGLTGSGDSRRGVGGESGLKDRLAELKDSRRKSTVLTSGFNFGGGNEQDEEGSGRSGSWWGWR